MSLGRSATLDTKSTQKNGCISDCKVLRYVMGNQNWEQLNKFKSVIMKFTSSKATLKEAWAVLVVFSPLCSKPGRWGVR